MANGIARGRRQDGSGGGGDGDSVIARNGGHAPANRLMRHSVLVYYVLLRFSTSMLWSIDTCENKVSADQCHATISGTQV